MGTRGTRTTLARNIYQDKYGISVLVTKRRDGVKLQPEQRFPLGTPLAELKQARKDLLDDLRGTTIPVERGGTLAADIAAYLQTFPPGSARRRDESALLQHWIDADFGGRPRTSLNSLEIRQQLAAWAGRFKPATLNHLRRALAAVYRAMNGKAGENPVRDVPKLTVRYEEPRAIPYELIEWIFAHMPDIGQPEKGNRKKDGKAGRSTVNKTKLRLRVMAYTGLPPAQLGRVLPRDLHLRAKEVYGRPRRKGAGVEGYRLALTKEGVREFRVFAQHGCFGRFSARSAAKRWRAAVLRARAAWLTTHKAWPLPDDVRAYDLRHSFGTQLYANTGDLQATADMLMHASLTTTRRYTKAAVTARLKAAAAAWTDGRKVGTR